MKTRTGFASNSSSSSFMITNISNQPKTLVDFIKENPHLIEQYGGCGFTQEDLLISAEENNISFNPEERKYCTFGDQGEDLIGHVLYELPTSGQSESFIWGNGFIN